MTDYSANDPTLPDLLSRAAQSEIGRTHGPIPAKVMAYTGATQRADVRPVIGVVDEQGIVGQHPIIQGVPVAWPKGYTCPLAAGDWVLLVPQDRDVSLWATTGTEGQAAPSAGSCTLSASHLIAVPCATPLNAPLAATEWSASGPVVNGTLVFLGPSTTTTWAARADKVDQEITKLWNAIAGISSHTHAPGTYTAPVGGGPVTGTSGVGAHGGSGATVASGKVRLA